eukprot:2546694-Rhodomonas_salina.2
MRCDVIQCDAMQCDAMPCDTVQCDVAEHTEHTEQNATPQASVLSESSAIHQRNRSSCTKLPADSVTSGGRNVEHVGDGAREFPAPGAKSAMVLGLCYAVSGADGASDGTSGCRALTDLDLAAVRLWHAMSGTEMRWHVRSSVWSGAWPGSTTGTAAPAASGLRYACFLPDPRNPDT